MELNNAHRERKLVPQRFLVYSLASLAVHALLFAFFIFWVGRMPDAVIIAAGEGKDGTGEGGAIEVGIASSAELGFARKQTASALEGNKDDKINNERLQHVADEDLLPDKKRIDPEARKTNLPVPTKEERRWTPKVQRASSNETSASVSTTYGSQKPTIQGGIGVGKGEGSGLGTGLPGGSEYGRRIQSILSRNFTPPTIPVNGISNVVIYVKISRTGQITSVTGGRVPRNYFKQSSPYEQLNYAAERAIIASAAQGLPPFPSNFLVGTQEAVAEIWFQYP
jgi:hypothetical protein